MMNRKKTDAVLAVIITVMIATVICCISRLYYSAKAAKDFFAQTGISTTYEPPRVVESKEDFLRGIYKLALWEQQTRDAIDGVFGDTKADLQAPVKVLYGFEPTEVLSAAAMQHQWITAQMAVYSETEDQINSWFGNEDVMYDIEKADVVSCHGRDGFEILVSAGKNLDEGKGMTAYEDMCNGLEIEWNSVQEWSAVPMDICFGLWPDLVMAGCEVSLKCAIESNDLYKIRWAVTNADTFSERYDLKPENLEKARSQKNRLEYAGKPDIPATGMSTSQASSTKLGPPTRKTTEKGSWSHKQHTYGDMYWDQGNRQIFKAHYFDGKITEVWDTRSYSGSNRGRYTSGSYSSNISFDPDDHDIGSYYEDNRDVYDDYEDAYEGFLDDKEAWDDY